MFDYFDDIHKKGTLTIVIMSILAIFLSGIFFSIIYFVMDTVQTGFEGTNCTIENNVLVDNCQELWALSIYPFLALKNIIVWASFFFIFALVIGLLIVGYKSGSNPVLMGLLIVFVMILTYGAIELSNIYRTMLEVEAFRTMLIDFTVYNKIMLNFPWFVFIVSLLAVILSIVNYQRVKVNSEESNEQYNY